MACVLFNVYVKPTGELKLFCDHFKLTWEDVKNITSRPLTSFSKLPDYDIACNFMGSIWTNMGFHHCFSPFCFTDQVVTSCMGLIIKGLWFTYTHTEASMCFSRRPNLYSASSRSRCFKSGYQFANKFARMKRCYYYKSKMFIQALHENNFGLRRGKWREIFRTKALSALREWVFSPSIGPQESKEKLQKH